MTGKAESAIGVGLGRGCAVPEPTGQSEEEST
jgi:hypothetical protein